MAGTTWLKIIGSMNSPSSASAGEPLRGSTTKGMVQHVTAGLLVGQSNWGGGPGWPKVGRPCPGNSCGWLFHLLSEQGWWGHNGKADCSHSSKVPSCARSPLSKCEFLKVLRVRHWGAGEKICCSSHGPTAQGTPESPIH